MNDHFHAIRDCTQIRLTLLGGFRLTVGDREPALPLSVQRVLGAVAVLPQAQDRAVLGAMLYPDGRRTQVAASLRSALWRAKRAAGRELIGNDGQRLRLADDVTVDLHRWTRCARHLTSAPAIDAPANCLELIEALSQELLPGWGEEWLILQRQRWDHVRLHALEQVTEQFARVGRYVEALEAGLAAVSIEPYRETAHRALIRAYIAEGNSASALAQYHRYQRLLRRELGVRPTPELEALVDRLIAN
jgi:DNA-binding SARP family transcriptional activator